MDFLLSLSQDKNGLIYISAFLAPILFFGLKRYGLAITSLISIGFSLFMFSQYKSNLSFFAEELSVFIYLTQALNICAVSLVMAKLFKRKKQFIVQNKEEEQHIEVEEEQKNIEIKDFNDLLRVKGILEKDNYNKKKRA